MPKPKRPGQPPYQVVNPKTNPLLNNNLSYPNGTYLPSVNLNPGTASIGGTGQFGAMLPQVNTGGQQLFGLTAGAGLSRRTEQAAPFMTQSMLPKPPAPVLPSDVIRSQNPPTSTPQVKTPSYSTLAERQAATKDFNLASTQQYTAAKTDFTNFLTTAETTGELNFDLLPQNMSLTTMNRLNLSAADMQEYGYKIVGGQWVQQNSTQAQTVAQTQQAQQAAATNSDFMQTGFMQQNAAEGVSFNNQLRWDPSTGTYQKIGKLIAQGKLDNATGKTTKKGKTKATDRRAAQAQQQQSPSQQAQGMSYNIGSVTGNFNTSSG